MSRRRGQPRTQRPTSVHLTIVRRSRPQREASREGLLRRPSAPTRRRRGSPASPERRPAAGRSSRLTRARPRAGAASTFPIRELVRRRAGCSRGGFASDAGRRRRGPSSPLRAPRQRTPQPGPSKPRPLAGSPRLGSSASRTSPRYPRSPLSGWKVLPSLRRPLRGIPRLLCSASALPRDLKLLPGILPTPRRHRERLSGRLTLPTAEVRRAMSTLPAAGPPSGPRSFRRARPSRGTWTRPPLARHGAPRSFRRGRRRAAIWARRRLGRRSGPRRFPLVILGRGTGTRRRRWRRSDRRFWSLVGTCSGTSRLRCSDPRRRRSGIRWRFRGPRRRSGGRCRDPRCGGRDPATGVTGPMAGRGGGAPGRRLGTRRPLLRRRGGGSGWWRWCWRWRWPAGWPAGWWGWWRAGTRTCSAVRRRRAGPQQARRRPRCPREQLPGISCSRCWRRCCRRW